MTLAIRAARSDELTALAEAVAPQPLLSRYGVTAQGLARDLTAAIDRGEPVLVADEGAGAIGFAWFLYSGTFAAGGYLKLIALLPGQNNRGAGGALLDAVEREIATRARNVFLLVSHWNDGARRFYQRRGYREVGTLPAFVCADTDEIICWKRLVS